MPFITVLWLVNTIVSVGIFKFCARLIFKNVKNSLVWSSNPEKKLVGINIDNLIIVEEDDTTLIMDKNKKFFII